MEIKCVIIANKLGVHGAIKQKKVDFWKIIKNNRQNQASGWNTRSKYQSNTLTLNYQLVAFNVDTSGVLGPEAQDFLHEVGKRVFLECGDDRCHSFLKQFVTVHGPLKTHFEREINMFHKSHPGRIIKQYDVARLLEDNYYKITR